MTDDPIHAFLGDYAAAVLERRQASQRHCAG